MTIWISLFCSPSCRGQDEVGRHAEASVLASDDTDYGTFEEELKFLSAESIRV